MNTDYSFAERAADMVARMTLAQKTSQMVSSKSSAIAAGSDAAGTIGTGIRTYGWWSEALHGYASNGANDNANPTGMRNAVSYPISYSMSQTWDAELMYRVASAISDEIRELAPGLDSNLNFYSPTVNLARDPRWGRNTESFGEDPVASAKMAAQFVNGFQGLTMEGEPIDPNGYYKAGATIKHYLANNSENNRLQGVSNITEQENREYYSAVYRNIIKETKPTAIMASYNRIQIADAPYSPFTEMPGGINFYTLDTLLRQTFGFEGFVTGDCDALNTAASSGNGTAGTSATQGVAAGSYSGVGHSWRAPAYKWFGESENTSAAMTATISNPVLAGWGVMGGQELECNRGVAAGKTYSSNNPTGTVVTPLGRYTEEAVDVALAKLMEDRIRFGEWDDKTNYTGAPSESSGKVSWYDQAKDRLTSYGLAVPTTATAQAATTNALTMTDERLDLVGEAAAKSLVLLKNEKIEGVNGGEPLLPMNIPDSGSFSVGVYGSMRASTILGLYSSTRSAPGTEKQVNPFNGISAAIQAKNANATVTNVANFNAAAAAEYDYVIAVVGDSLGTSTAAEQRDRANFALAPADVTLINQLAGANKKLIVVMITACPIGEDASGTANFFNNVPSLLYSSFMGDRPGQGIGDVIVGNVNPSARTISVWYPVSSPYGDNNSTHGGSLNQIRSYRLSPGTDGPWQSPFGANFVPATPYTYVGPNRGRTYMYYNGTDNQAIRYPLGYGLSYTTFEYGSPKVYINGALQSNGTVNVNPNDKIDYTFTVTNTGSLAGADVAQLYVKTPTNFVAPDDKSAYAVKRLKDFVKTNELAPGESQEITLSVEVPDLAFWSNANGKFELVQDFDSNYYVLQVSRSSADSGSYNGQEYGAVLSSDLHINNAAGWNPKVSVLSFKPNTPADAANDIPQRLIYDVNDTVNPNPTVSMANDVLYGYINRMYSSSTDQMYPIPSNITVTYSSNRPSVVNVLPDGTIKAASGGVATITGTATDSLTGSSSSAEFVVYVQGEAVDHDASMLSVSYGEETIAVIPGSSEVDVNVPTTVTNINLADFTNANITPSYPDKVSATVSLQPSDGAVSAGAPCVATVTITSDENALITQTYKVNFGHMEAISLQNVNYMGLNSYASVRFSDGTTSYKLIQAFYKEGKLTFINVTNAAPLPKHTAGTISGQTDGPPGLSDFTANVFLWDEDYMPLIDSISEYIDQIVT
jgi:beta-glucosidase